MLKQLVDCEVRYAIEEGQFGHGLADVPEGFVLGLVLHGFGWVLDEILVGVYPFEGVEEGLVRFRQSLRGFFDFLSVLLVHGVNAAI